MSRTNVKKKTKVKTTNNGLEDVISALVVIELLSAIFIQVFPFFSALLTLLALTQRDVQSELIFLYIGLLIAFVMSFIVPRLIRRFRSHE